MLISHRRTHDGRHRQDQGNAHTHKSHALGVFLKPHNGLDALGNVLPTVGQRCGTHRTGIRLVCHGQQNHTVVTALLPVQQLQHPLIAQGFHVVADAVAHPLEIGIAPVEAAHGTPEHTLGSIPMLQMQQLVEDDLIIEIFPLGDGQHGLHHTAHKGRVDALHHNSGTLRQAIPLPHPHKLCFRVIVGCFPLAQQQTQLDISQEIPQSKCRHPHGIDHKQVIRHRHGSAHKHRQHMVCFNGTVNFRKSRGLR